MLEKNHQADQSFRSLFEKRFTYFMSPLETFIHKQTTAGILLMTFSLISFISFNSPWHYILNDLAQLKLGVIFGSFHLFLSLNRWISEGLMALFFFLAGLEIKREILAGRLSDKKEIYLISCAAIGGILFPALIYFIINRGGVGQYGWGIPTATDTAFTIGVLTLMARRVSIGLTVFLTALAIFDDIGAIISITFFYAHKIDMFAALVMVLLLSLLFLANRAGIRRGWFYGVMGVLLWWFVMKTGLHPTFAGLLLAMAIPARTNISQSKFIKNIYGLLSRFEQKQSSDISMLGSLGKHSIVSDIGQNVRQASTPLQRWENGMITPIAIIVLPLFALFNAGFTLTADLIHQGMQSSITWGIIAGLVFGKPLGILSCSYLCLKAGWGKLPEGLRFNDIIGVSLLAGIGFTMSVFFTTLSFPGQHGLIELAKLGILMASLLSACLGTLWIYMRLPVLEHAKNIKSS